MGDVLRVVQVCSARSAHYGAVQSMMTLSDALIARGHTVAFATFAGRGLGRTLRDKGYAVHDFRVRIKVDPIAAIRMARWMRRWSADVVHTHLSTSTINGCLAARLAGLPSVATVHGLSGKLSFMFADRLIAVSEAVRAHMVAQGWARERVDVVFNGLRGGAACEVGARAAFPVLGTVARVTALKGVHVAIQAMPRILERFPEATYVVVGDGDALGACRAQAESLGLNGHVKFLGYRHDVASLLRGWDAFVFPSLKEAMGIAVVEAMAAGLPVVASSAGGLPEVVGDAGVLTSAGDAGALASALLQILDDGALRADLSDRAKSRARTHFSAGTMADGTLAVYRKLLAIP